MAQYSNRSYSGKLAKTNWPISRQTTVGIILIVSLIAFEIFNFDTTRYALSNLIGDVRFAGMQWASILAIAFCSIDFAGLIRLFTPEQGRDEPTVVWYLMGAWLLGATMNAVMTWWAISLTLLNHNFGNEVLTRQQLLLYVPIFVAILVWLTRILFIGAFTVAGEHIFEFSASNASNSSNKTYKNNTSRAKPKSSTAGGYRRSTPAVSRVAAPRTTSTNTMHRAAPKPKPTMSSAPNVVEDMETQIYDQSDQYVQREPAPARQPVRQPAASRVRQRPPRPNGGYNRPNMMKAKGNDRH